MSRPLAFTAGFSLAMLATGAALIVGARAIRRALPL